MIKKTKTILDESLSSIVEEAVVSSKEDYLLIQAIDIRVGYFAGAFYHMTTEEFMKKIKSPQYDGVEKMRADLWLELKDRGYSNTQISVWCGRSLAKRLLESSKNIK